jgi:hypothetical protein
VADWIGNGFLMPALESASESRSDTPSSSNVAATGMGRCAACSRALVVLF